MRLILPKRKRNYGYFKYHFSKKKYLSKYLWFKKIKYKKNIFTCQVNLNIFYFLYV